MKIAGPNHNLDEGDIFQDQRFLLREYLTKPLKFYTVHKFIVQTIET